MRMSHGKGGRKMEKAAEETSPKYEIILSNGVGFTWSEEDLDFGDTLDVTDKEHIVLATIKRVR